jgi:O-antigen/teichoic acid export membrane protein
MSDQEHAVRQVRGSSVLLIGRVISLCVNLLLQLLLVRYFTKEVFGAFAFAWATVEFGVFLVTIGLNKSLARYIPEYQEAGDRPRMRRMVLATMGVIFGTGCLAVAATYVAGGWMLEQGWLDPLSLRLLQILILLVPLDAVGFLFQDLFVAFEDITAVFVRRYVVAPGLRLAGVISVMVLGGDAEWMAVGYVAGGAIGLLLYLWLFRKLWRTKMQGNSTTDQPTQGFAVLLRYGVAVLFSQLGTVFRMTAVIYLLKIMCDSSEVGDYRAVLPFARLNLMVVDSFTLAFVPAATRLLMRREEHLIGRLVDTCVTWVTVLSFPIFLASFAFSTSLSTYALGANYADTWPIMSVLAVGFLAESMLGFAPFVLRAHAKLRPVLYADWAALLVNIVLALVLTPKWGALGAATSVAASSVVAAAAVMMAARRVNPTACRWLTIARLFGATAAIAGAVALLMWTWPIPLAAQALIAIVAVLIFLQCFRQRLVVDDVFPELRKYPFVSWFIPRNSQPVPEN